MHIPDAEEHGAIDMSTTDERENLINEICQYLMPLIPDVADAKAALYIITNKYEIMSRSTELAKAEGSRNEELIKRFLVAKAVKGCTPKTLDYYDFCVKRIIWAIGKTVDDITADDIRCYMAVRQRRDGVQQVTIGNEIRCLRSFFQWATAEEIVGKNPMVKIDGVKIQKKRKEALTEIEIEKLRAATSDEREKAVIEILLSTGCRVSEIIQIRLEEISTDRVLIHGKGQKDRYVYLNAKAAFAIEAYLEKRKDKSQWLFPGCLGAAEILKSEGRDSLKYWWIDPRNLTKGHISAGAVEGMTRKIAKRAGVRRANPHKFRRTCATMALRRGMPIEQVSKMLGHEEIGTTQIYLDLTEDELALAHKKYVI